MAPNTGNLTKLKAKRSSLTSQLIRFGEFVNEFTVDKADQLGPRIEKCEELWDQFHSVQNDIAESDASAVQNQELVDFEENYFRIIGAAKSAFRNLSEEEPRPAPGGNRGAITNVKLPIMEIPYFSGGYEDWPEFCDIFKSLIHDNSDLTSVQKFYYLKNAIKGDAADVLHSLEVSDDNYVVAWDLLKERFENKKIITLSHIETLFNFQNITRESHSSLRKMLDETRKSIRALKSLGQPVDSWDTLLIFILDKKLDPSSKREWQAQTNTSTFPKIDDFLKFLAHRCQILEATDTNKTSNNKVSTENRFDNSNKYRGFKSVSRSFVTTRQACAICKDQHFIYQCKQFLGLTTEARRAEVQKLNLCWNCLGTDHRVNHCFSRGCKHCGKKHNSLLHEGRTEQTRVILEQSSHTNHSTVNSNQTNITEGAGSSNIASSNKVSARSANTALLSNTTTREELSREILLSTALVFILDHFGNKHECRALLDSGSQSNFISRRMNEILKLPCQNIKIPIIGINQSVSNISGVVSATICSRVDEFKTKTSFLILDEITQTLPSISLQKDSFRIPDNLKLADSQFNISGNIDLLIGAEIFWDLLCVGQVKLGKGQPVMQKTKLGWVISGTVTTLNRNKSDMTNRAKVCNTAIVSDIQEQLERFWHIEECESEPILTREQTMCEDIFKNTATRDKDGRFILSLPIKGDITELGDSLNMAQKRFYALERKLEKNPEFQRQYKDFMEEYERLGHMSRIEAQNEIVESPLVTYYLPHHGVVRESSTTTKLRVVFDASAETDTHVSLNNKLMVGPKIQQDLFSILVRFRKHAIVLVGDVVKMYRQILIKEEHRDLQRILWRPGKEQPLQHYRLNTVTYGTASAPFLAVRCLYQLGLENHEKFPTASEAIMKDFYVDDLLTGANTEEDAIQLNQEISKILMGGRFCLRKWLSNSRHVLENMKANEESVEHYIADESTTKTLGIIWNSNSDQLHYKVDIKQNESRRVTKRTILSIVSQLFDPLGLIGPSIIQAKRILQQLWQLKLNWDETVPLDLHTAWSSFNMGIGQLNSIEVPRHAMSSNSNNIQLHCFADASETAYGTCIYVRSTDDGNVHDIQLLCAKSRVAPLKTITLPRLELCGALLMAKLTRVVTKSLDMNIDSIWYWCDSTIVLSWLAGEPSEYKTFVANRVSEIQRLTKGHQWNHIKSQDNPADVISRGMKPEQLIECNLWWKGPSWLATDQNIWPNPKFSIASDLPDKKTVKQIFLSNMSFELFDKYSTFTRLLRVVAYCMRFRTNTLGRTHNMGALTVSELENSLSCLIKLAQSQCFHSEIHALRQSKQIQVSSKLIMLNPFIDAEGILRVGGRLNKADICYGQRHQIILGKDHTFTKLLIIHEHLKHLHSGAQALLSIIRLRYWPVGGRNTIRGILRKCVICFRNKPKEYQHIMGQLPTNRVTPARAFSNCGLDYAGPFEVKASKLRGHKVIKGYMCIFICFATKACHLELVGDLSTEGFLNCFKRFISRRGLPKNMYSDIATNFVGANNVIKPLYEFLNEQTHQTKFQEFFTRQSINWHFIPPRSPHFGGLWESGVRVAKYHLNRVVGNLILTFEELYTIMTQVEACMNSRPLTQLTEDPSDLNALTPGHFLIGTPITALPEADLKDFNPGRLNRYQHMTQLVQHFWTRWSREYLSLLQQRNKWQSSTDQVLPGNMVIVKEDNLPPLKWQLARVLELCSGDDNVARVAVIKTSKGVFKRALSKLCILPIDTQ